MMKKDVSRTIAFQRLKSLLNEENHELDEEVMSSIRKEVGNVILKYVDIEPEDVNVKIFLKEYKKKELC